MSNSLDSGFNYNLWVLMRQTRDAMSKARERELEKLGVSSIQAAVLFNIQVIGEEATPAELSRRLVREPHSISGLLSRMEKQGLVRRVKDLPRRNMVRIEMTDKGKEIYDKSIKRLAIHEIMSVLPERAKKELWTYLEELREKAFKTIGRSYKLPFEQLYPESMDY
jgi:MarR family transcriptional regulator, organic hydroperoxide resistance regulator